MLEDSLKRLGLVGGQRMTQVGMAHAQDAWAEFCALTLSPVLRCFVLETLRGQESEGRGRNVNRKRETGIRET